jgi:molybdate transport system substrate-binding protein
VRPASARAAVVTLLVAALAGCGGGEAGERPALVVSAASSLRTAFADYAGDFGAARVRLSFAGSDELAAQIRQGVRPDVFAAADADLPAALHAEGLVGEPVAFASNRLVLAVPAGDGQVRSLDDLARPGTTIAIGQASVPVGAYARELLARLEEGRGAAILANVRSEEPDVAGIVGKLAQGAVDAGFVYATDVAAAGDAVRAIELPERLRPPVAYAVAVVRGAPHPALARAFVDGLLRGAGAAALHAAGFAPAPPAPAAR